MISGNLVYILYWAALVAMLAFGWKRSRNFLHPHLMFTAMLGVFCSDFLVRGYDHELVSLIPKDDLYYYQLLVLGAFIALCFLTAQFRNPRVEMAVSDAWKSLTVTRRALRIFQIVAWTILIVDLLMRLSSVHWSLEEMISQMQNARGERDWDQAQYSGNFVFAIIGLLLPLSAVTYAYVAINSWRFVVTPAGILLYAINLAGYAVALVILITDGSRTPVVISLAAPCIFITLTDWSRLAKTVACGSIGFVGAMVLSIMYLLRSTGFSAEAITGTSTKLGFVYHQDDSYFRALYAFSYADRGLGSWDPFFFVYATLANPIPRYFWPDKPLFDEQFYGGYKLYYVTNLFVGEIVAMSGTALAPVVSVIVGLGVYWVLYRAALLLRYPLGVIAYILVALYVYMAMRSLMNLMLFVYLPAFAVLLARAAGRSKKRERMAQALVHRVQSDRN